MFIETRGNDHKKPSRVTFSQALLSPSASFGGLYVPEKLPTIDTQWLESSKALSYKELSLKILGMFDLDVETKTLKEALNLYDNFDDPKNPVPLVKVEEGLHVSELYHGPTRAFKDMALQPFGHILSCLAEQKDENYLILAATSGDTGPATLETFKNKPNIKIVCLYPDGGTSDVQRLQMVTNDGKNIKVLGIHGNFDDAQKALKNLLNSATFDKSLAERNIKLSAANSVNFGRIIFQIVYHVFGYLKLLERGEIGKKEKIYLTIPSGNFGNALGAYYAKKMGLPIEKILIASNINNILTDLIKKGKYDIRERRLLLTTSPAMDILISSNVERVLYDKFGQKRCKELMESLHVKGHYELTNKELRAIREDFDATYSDDNFAKKTINEFAKKGYILDPHTATCLRAKELIVKPLQNIIASTAQWTKFAPTMLNALHENSVKYTDIQALEGVEKALHVKRPIDIDVLFSKDVVHKEIVEKNQIEQTIIQFLSE